MTNDYTTLVYEDLDFNLALKDQVKGHAMIPKDRTVVRKDRTVHLKWLRYGTMRSS